MLYVGAIYSQYVNVLAYIWYYVRTSELSSSHSPTAVCNTPSSADIISQ